ncbi:ISKra4 family transposase [Singulisphaera acidiphila]|uniref:ISKra4 family transposase n=2 Tax=Singulisphaera acidiphila TaxID=466153 RepID=L0D9S2_SINAD|nr:ISKra4 family transposase [Singulisphaera acidiphila]AGA25620.1 hypothetical protein Sinac_1231 [Singulisphaera acidiphila DSM 18658]
MAPLRQNIGYHTRMFSPTKGTAMIMNQEQALLKAQVQLNQLIESVHSAAAAAWRIHQVERDLMAQLLDLGLTLLNLFIAHHGDGDLGTTAGTVDGRTVVQRLPQKHDRRYVAIFGELTSPRVVYGTREGQRIERAPLDESLGLPGGDFSYVIEDWAQRFGLKGSFAEAAESLQTLLRLRLGVHTLERMSQEMAGSVVPFREAIEPPPAVDEGPILVVTADGKGIPMRRPPQEGPKPHHRRTKGEKANKKQMACVGAVYSIKPFVRTPNDVLDEVLRDRCSDDRPEPTHKHVWAEMSRDIEGKPIGAKDAIFCALFQDLTLRNVGHDRPVVCVMDGERALWEAQRVYFPEAVGILDLFHVMERLWTAAHCFHAEGSDDAEAFVADRLRGLLEGRVGYVIGGLRQRLAKHQLKGSRRKTLTSVITYLENNREHLRYDEYLKAGYPIGSGVAEGACRHLVKDRLEQTGMRWTVSGAQAMRHLRATYLNDQWDDFIEKRIDCEQTRLYGKNAA